MLKHGHIRNQHTQISMKKTKKNFRKKFHVPYHFFHRVKTKNVFQKKNTMCNTSENSLFNGTSLDSVACKMPKSIKEQTDGHGSCNLYLGNLNFIEFLYHPHQKIEKNCFNFIIILSDSVPFFPPKNTPTGLGFFIGLEILT